MISKRSRYAETVLYRDGRNEFFGLRRPLDLPPSPDDRFHVVVEGDRVDLLAHRYLGRADLWWVICDVNGIGWPMELEVGMVLRIPAAVSLSVRSI